MPDVWQVTEYKTITIEDDEHYCLATVNITYTRVDESFDHDFGTKRRYMYEPSSIEVCSVTNINAPLSDLTMTPELMAKIEAKALE